MEHTVADTAKAILADRSIGLNIEDSDEHLRQMAKLWLTLPRIREALGHYQETEGRKFAFDPDGWSPAIDVLGLLESIDPSERTKLAELEK